MPRSIRLCLLLTPLLVFAPQAAKAVPILQLDIAGGVYDPGSQTVVSSSNPLTLYAYATPSGNETAASLLGRQYILSVALTPPVGPAHEALGSISVDGTPYTVTADMTYGIPPIESNGTAVHDGGDLGGHGIFETFYLEIPFTLTAANTSGEYNTQDDAGQGPIPGTDMFYVAFEVDKSGLAADSQLHFDVYSTEPGQQNGDSDIDLFAPFSHDAATIPGKPVPEPTAALVFAIGLAATRYAGRRK